MKRVFIIHGWEGHPENAWFPWLKKELEQKRVSQEVIEKINEVLKLEPPKGFSFVGEK